MPQQETESSTKQLALTDPILGPENLLKTGFAQKGLPSMFAMCCTCSELLGQQHQLFFLWFGRCRSEARSCNWYKQIKRIKTSRLKRSGSSCNKINGKKQSTTKKANRNQNKRTRKSPSQIYVSPQKPTAKQQENGVGVQHKNKPTHTMTICH